MSERPFQLYGRVAMFKSMIASTSRPLFLRRPPHLRKPNVVVASLTKQNLQVSTSTAPSSSTPRPTKIPTRRRLTTRTREATSTTSTTSTTVSPPINSTENSLRSRFRFASRKPFLRTSTTTTTEDPKTPDQELSNAGDFAVVLHGLSTAPLPLGPKTTTPKPSSSLGLAQYKASTPASINSFSRGASRFTFDRGPQKFPEHRHKGFAQVYDLSPSVSPNANLISRTPNPTKYLTPDEYMKLTTASGKLILPTATPTQSTRGSVTFVTAFGPQGPTTGPIQYSSTNGPVQFTSTNGPIQYSSTKGPIQYSSTEAPTATAYTLSPGSSGIINHVKSNDPQKLISTTLPPARSELTFISQSPRGETSQVRTITSHAFPPGLYKQLSSGTPTRNSPSSEKSLFSYIPSTGLGGVTSPGQQITPHEYTSSERPDKLTLIARNPGEEYDYYDAAVLTHLPPNSKVLVLPSGAVQCLDRGNFPHPSSCKKFISCYDGGAGEGLVGWEYMCPKGLSFDPVGGICNWSAGLGCKHIN